MSAIGSVAAAAEQAFVPYAERVLELMKVFMVLTNDDDLLSRARATELVGIVAKSVGRTRMEPILPPFIEAAISGFGLEFSELREYTHGFFSNIAEILDEGFAQYLPRVVPLAFTSCNLDDGSAFDIDDSGDENGVLSDDEPHDEPRVRNISIRTGVLDEKAAATQALGLYALHTKSFYVPYLEESLKILVRHSSYFHEDVRLQAIISLKYILIATQAALQGRNGGMAKTKEVLDSVMKIYIKTMTEDDVKAVVAQACMAVADILKDFDYIAVEPYVAQLVETTVVLLHEQSACQLVESDGEDDDDTEHDERLMDAFSDLLPALAKAMGSNFAPIFSKLFKPLMDWQKWRSPRFRTMVIATLAGVAQHMGAPIGGYFDTVMPLVLKQLASATDNAVRDNAAGAVARMIMVHPETIPLNEVLPVLLKVLPLKDHEESAAVYGCICNLVLSSNSQIILSLVPELVNAFAQVAMSPVETPEVKAHVGRTYAHLTLKYGDEMQALLNDLSPAHANALQLLYLRADM